MAEADKWSEYYQHLTEKFSNKGMSSSDAKLKAKTYNIWPILGFKYDELIHKCREHMEKVNKGEATDADGYPKVFINYINIDQIDSTRTE